MEKTGLSFPAEDFVLETEEFEGKKVVYRSYKHVQYVENPVDADYQSLDVKVPVEIGGKPVDASNAPILFMIGVGGYMSYRNRGREAGPEMPPPPAGIALPGMPVEENKGRILAGGFVMVEPGCRGRDNKFSDGRFYGKAPAALVDLKAALRFIRHNSAVMPGNPDWIVTMGGSAGGALSTLLAVSGNAPELDEYLAEIGAAQERDDVFMSAAYSPIIDLEHADGAYEWEFGKIPAKGPFADKHGHIDQALSAELAQIYREYQDGLRIEGRNGFGMLSCGNMEEYLLKEYVIPSAERFFGAMAEQERTEYLADRPWISRDGERLSFSFEDYARYCGRMKGLPAFDDFEKRMAEPKLFGSESVAARHFTEFSARHTGESPVEAEVLKLRSLMNPMYYLEQGSADFARNLWIRHGACDNHTALPVVTNFADKALSLGLDVNARLVWDGGHCADDDAHDLMARIEQLTGYSI